MRFKQKYLSYNLYSEFRILVIYQGRFVANLNPQDITPEDLGAYMTGLKKWKLNIN